MGPHRSSVEFSPSLKSHNRQSFCQVAFQYNLRTGILGLRGIVPVDAVLLVETLAILSHREPLRKVDLQQLHAQGIDSESTRRIAET